MVFNGYEPEEELNFLGFTHGLLKLFNLLLNDLSLFVELFQLVFVKVVFLFFELKQRGSKTVALLEQYLHI